MRNLESGAIEQLSFLGVGGKMGRNQKTEIIEKQVRDRVTGEVRTARFHADHGRPTSRRDFLASGALGFVGYMMTPSVLSLLTRSKAYAQTSDTCVVPDAGLPLFCTVNLSGGASLSSNYIPLGAAGSSGRDPISTYTALGLGAGNAFFQDATRSQSLFQGVRMAGVLNAAGGTPGATAGFFWRGVMERATAATIDRTSMIAICVTTNDDTSQNQLDASGLVIAAGRSGELLPNLGTNGGTGTGVNQQAARIDPPAPLIVGGIADIVNSLRPVGVLGTNLSEPRRRKLFELVNSLSGTQARSIASPNSATGQVLSKLVECATGKNVELASRSPVVDPNGDTVNGGSRVMTAFAATANSTAHAQAAMVYNGLLGNASTIGYDLGGYDYHGSGRANQNNQDQAAGRIVGSVLESARVMNRPVFIYVTTDGSVGSASDTFGADFNSDRGLGGMSYCIAYDPNARPRVKSDRFGYQVGHYTAGQGAATDSTTPVPNAERASAAAFANYLEFAKQRTILDRVLPGYFETRQLDEVIRFE